MSPFATPVLVYLPGLDGTGRLLHRQPGLERGYRVEPIAYPHAPPSTYEQLAGLAAARIEQAGGQPAVILAESFGGAVALTLALGWPHLVERLVLVNTFAWYPGRLRIRLGAWLGQFFPPRPSHPATRGVRGLFFFPPDISSEERTAWWDRTADVPMSAFGHRLGLIVSLDLRRHLHKVTAPCLVIGAPNDRVVPFRASRELVRRLPNARLLILPVGHAALIHPRTDIAGFLAEPRYWPASAPATAEMLSAGRPG
jgi:pimeloyl-ACP methyl ester carboxylesterase